MKRLEDHLVIVICLALAMALGVAASVAVAMDSHADKPKTIKLFNGTNLDGWTYKLTNDDVKMEDVWSVEDGMMICKGRPAGYLRTKEAYADYKLTVEWRWKPGTKGGNSGVLVHTSTPGAIGVWPKSMEVQLAANNAGDFWVIGEDIKADDMDKRRQGRRIRNLTDDSENKPGEWNEMNVICKDDTITVYVNGDLVNKGWDSTTSKGAICLQSEGAEIHFRKVELLPLTE